MTSNLISGNMPVLQVSLKRWKCASIVLHATLGIKKNIPVLCKENHNKF